MKTLKSKFRLSPLSALVGFYALVFAVLAVAWLVSPAKGPAAASSGASAPARVVSNEVTLRAESWNNGKVYVWHDLVEGPDARYTTVPGGARCTKVDNASHKLGTGSTAIYYHKLNCGGVVGYVQRNQAN